MQYTKALVDLIQEARRRAPNEAKPSIKLANPNVLYELITLYQQSSDAVFKALIKEICNQAGEEWAERLEQPAEANPSTSEEQYTLRVYRGKTILEPKRPTEEAKENLSRKQRIYRGRVVA